MNCLKCNFARKFPGDCKYVVCERFGGFRRVDGKCPKALVTNGDMLKALNDLRLFIVRSALLVQKKAVKHIVARIAGKSGLNHPLTWSFGDFLRRKGENED